MKVYKCICILDNELTINKYYTAEFIDKNTIELYNDRGIKKEYCIHTPTITWFIECTSEYRNIIIDDILS